MAAATTTTVNVIRTGSTIGSNKKRYKTGVIISGAYAAQGDKWLVGNAKKVIHCIATVDADGTFNPTSNITGRTITLNGATATASSAQIVYI